MDWKPIPGGEEYYICKQGLVIRGKHLGNGNPNLDKAIKPSVQGKHCYVRIRRQGKEKKIQLYKVLLDLYPDLFESEVVVETLKGPWSLTQEMQGGRLATSDVQRIERQEHSQVCPVRTTIEPDAAARLVKIPAAGYIETESDGYDGGCKRCLTCDVKKNLKEFSLKQDICNDCFLDREELLKEIVNKRLKLLRRPG
ncbi:conserved hypothetical protein [Desulfovibrionales bacterium]